MRSLIAIAAASALLVTGVAMAAPATCQDQAKEKKLAGAAQKSFLKKCEDDSRIACTKQSAEKKLAGAAKKSFETKCVNDAVGSAAKSG